MSMTPPKSRMTAVGVKNRPSAMIFRFSSMLMKMTKTYSPICRERGGLVYNSIQWKWAVFHVFQWFYHRYMVFLGTTQGEVPKACGKVRQHRALSGLFLLNSYILLAIYQQFFCKVILFISLTVSCLWLLSNVEALIKSMWSQMCVYLYFIMTLC